MDRDATLRVARAGARLAARLGGLGDLLTFYDEARPGARAARHALIDKDTVETITKDIIRHIDSNSELARQNLPPNEVRAAANAVVDQLSRAPLREVNASILSANGLFRAVVGNETHVHRDLGNEETFQLYRFLLYETCAALCKSFLGNPAFVPIVLTEILRRHDDGVLATWRAERTSSNSRLALQWHLATQSYCSRLLLQLDRFESAGIDINYFKRSASLSEAFTVPTLSGVGPGEPMIESLLDRGTSTLLTSPAGNGKSSLLRYIAIQAADRTLRTGTIHDRMLPFHIKLRDVGSNLSLTNALVPQLTGHAIPIPEDFLLRQVESGHAALLLDGYDEVAPRRQLEVLYWINSLQEEYCRKGSVILVATRLSGSGDLESVLKNFTWRGLSLMDQPESRRFGRRWALTLQAARADVNSDVTVSATIPATIPKELPLHRLDAFLAVALGGPTSDLDQEARTLNRIVAMWCRRRDSERGIDHIGISGRAIEELLEEIALASVVAHAPMHPDELRAIVEALQESTTHVDLTEPRPGLVIDHLLMRTGIVEIAGGEVRFRSRAIRDYLAARGAVRRAAGGPLQFASGAGGAGGMLHWLGALATSEQLDGLLGALRQENIPLGNWHLMLLEMCGGARSLSKSCERLYRESVEWCIRNRGARDAALIARGGAKAVVAMKPLIATAVTEYELCTIIEVLAYSRSDDALLVLAELAQGSRGAVRDTLVKCMTSWGDDRYAKDILPLIPVSGPRLSVTLRDQDQLSLIDAIPSNISILVSLSEPLCGEVEFSEHLIDHVEVSGLACGDLSILLQRYPNVRRVTLRDATDGILHGLTGVFPKVGIVEIDARFGTRTATGARSPRLMLSSDDLLRHFPGAKRLVTIGPIALKVGPETNVSELQIISPFSVDVSTAEVKSVKRVILHNYPQETASWLTAFPRLEVLEIVGADQLQSLAVGDGFAALRDLKLADCRELWQVPDMSLLDALETVLVEGCTQLKQNALGNLRGEFHLSLDEAAEAQPDDRETWFDHRDLLDAERSQDPETLAPLDALLDDESKSETVGAVVERTDPRRTAASGRQRGNQAGQASSAHSRVTFAATLLAMTESLLASRSDDAISRDVLAWLDWLAAAAAYRPHISQLTIDEKSLSNLLRDGNIVRELYSRARRPLSLETSLEVIVEALGSTMTIRTNPDGGRRSSNRD